MTDQAPTRRAVVTTGAGAALGLAGLTLAACGSGSSSGSSGGAAGPGGAGSSGAAGGSGALATLAEVPVGGAASAKDSSGAPIIIAQPSAGKIVAFSAICTHMGCTVAPKGKDLVCPCHGSTYNAFTGAVISGPAPKPLPAVSVKVDGSNVVSG